MRTQRTISGEKLSRIQLNKKKCNLLFQVIDEQRGKVFDVTAASGSSGNFRNVSTSPADDVGASRQRRRLAASRHREVVAASLDPATGNFDVSSSAAAVVSAAVVVVGVVEPLPGFEPPDADVDADGVGLRVAAVVGRRAEDVAASVDGVAVQNCKPGSHSTSGNQSVTRFAPTAP